MTDDEAKDEAIHALLEEINTLEGVEVLGVNHLGRFGGPEDVMLTLRLQMARAQLLKPFVMEAINQEDGEALFMEMLVQEESVSPHFLRFQVVFRSARAHEAFTALLEHFQQTGTSYTGAAAEVSILNAAFAVEGSEREPITFQVPGMNGYVLILFSTKDKLIEFYRARGNPNPDYRFVTNEEEFLASLAEVGVTPVFDPYTTPEGRTRFQVIHPR